MNQFYVYLYFDPRKPGKFNYGQYQFDYEPFYIGKGIRERISDHLAEWHLKKDNNKLKTNKIKKIKIEIGKPIIIKFKKFLSNDEANNLEILLIKTIGRKNLGLGPLTNLTNGGEGTCERICTEETKQKISKKNKGRKFTLEQRKRISEGHSGPKNYMYGKPISKERKEQLNLHRRLQNGSFNIRAIFNYNITDVNGNFYMSNCLKDFCKERNIIYSSFKDAISRNKPYKGWSAFKTLKTHDNTSENEIKIRIMK